MPEIISIKQKSIKTRFVKASKSPIDSKVMTKHLLHINKSIKKLTDIAQNQQTNHEDLQVSLTTLTAMVRDLKVLVEFDLEERVSNLEKTLMYRM